MLSAHFTGAYLMDDSVMTEGLGNTWNLGSRFSQALAIWSGPKFVVGIAVSMLAGSLLAMSKHKLQAGSPSVPSVLISDPLWEVPEYAGPALLQLQPAFSSGDIRVVLCPGVTGITSKSPVSAWPPGVRPDPGAPVRPLQPCST